VTDTLREDARYLVVNRIDVGTVWRHRCGGNAVLEAIAKVSGKVQTLDPHPSQTTTAKDHSVLSRALWGPASNAGYTPSINAPLNPVIKFRHDNYDRDEQPLKQ